MDKCKMYLLFATVTSIAAISIYVLSLNKSTAEAKATRSLTIVMDGGGNGSN